MHCNESREISTINILNILKNIDKFDFPKKVNYLYNYKYDKH